MSARSCCSSCSWRCFISLTVADSCSTVEVTRCFSDDIYTIHKPQVSLLWICLTILGTYSTCMGHSPKVKVKVHTLDIAPLRSESPPQKCSGIARVLKGFHSFTCTPTRLSTIGMSHICICLLSYGCYSFTDPGGTEGWVDLGAK